MVFRLHSHCYTGKNGRKQRTSSDNKSYSLKTHSSGGYRSHAS